jgi:hypothetical protein
MDPDQPAHPCSLIWMYTVRLQTLLQVEKLIANSMDPDLTKNNISMKRLISINTVTKSVLQTTRTKLVAVLL